MIIAAGVVEGNADTVP